MSEKKSFGKLSEKVIDARKLQEQAQREAVDEHENAFPSVFNKVVEFVVSRCAVRTNSSPVLERKIREKTEYGPQGVWEKPAQVNALKKVLQGLVPERIKKAVVEERYQHESSVETIDSPSTLEIHVLVDCFSNELFHTDLIKKILTHLNHFKLLTPELLNQSLPQSSITQVEVKFSALVPGITGTDIVPLGTAEDFSKVIDSYLAALKSEFTRYSSNRGPRFRTADSSLGFPEYLRNSPQKPTSGTHLNFFFLVTEFDRTQRDELQVEPIPGWGDTVCFVKV